MAPPSADDSILTVVGTSQQSTKMIQKTLDGPPLAAKTVELLETENEYSVGGFAPIPAFFQSGKGSIMIDVNGHEVIDFIAAFSATNMGQCHPKIVQAVTKTAQQMTLTNLASHTASWPGFAKLMCQRFGYDKISTMTSGAEAADTACKIARKWGCQVKGIPPRDVLILGTTENYHGLTSGVWPLMDLDDTRREYATFSSNMANTNLITGKPLRYGYVEDMEECLEQMHGRVAAVIMECIHGHLKSFQEEIDYASGVQKLCKKYNVLFIADEVRMGAAKTGRFLSSEWLGPECKPDIITMGKSITGGAFPASYILGTKEVMSLVGPYETASTFAMSPMAVAVTQAALGIIDDENLLQRATSIGKQFEEVASTWKHPFIEFTTARGADLNIKLVANYPNTRVTARRIALLCYHKGLLVFPLTGRVRMSVAMTITDELLQKGFAILKEALDEVTEYDSIPGSTHIADSIR